MPPKRGPGAKEQLKIHRNLSLFVAGQAVQKGEEQTNDRESNSTLQVPEVINSRSFRKRRGKHVTPIDKDYLYANSNRINVNKWSERAKPEEKKWVAKARQLRNPMRCPLCGMGPYAKLSGKEGHMAFCRKSDQRDRVHREKVLADSGSYNPWSLSKQVVRKPPEDSASPPSKEPSRSLRKDSGQESFDPNDRQWCHPMSDSGLTKKYHDELCEAATPFLNALRSVYSRRNSTDPCICLNFTNGIFE